MIPIKLSLRNFLSYGEHVEPVSFEGIHLACLCGENGHGKSALLDAITWALWGKARISDRRDASEDELIQLGKTEMEVQFEFALDGNRYLVLRKRSIRGGARRRVESVLELQVADGSGVYRTLTGDSIHATQKKINDVLRMEYDSFINSVFILQGRADEFTRKTPTERKQVLSDLLGLATYDQLAELSRDNVRRAESERREHENAIAEIDRELEREEEYRAELLQVVERIAGLSEAIRQREGEVTSLRKDKQELDQKSRERGELIARTAREQQALQEIRAQMDLHRRQLAEQEEIVAQAVAIRAGHAALMAARAESDEMNGRLASLVTLNEDKGRLERAVAEARNHLTADLRVLSADIANLQKQIDSMPAYVRDKAELERQLAGLEELGAERDQKREALQGWRGQNEALKTSNARLREEMEQVKEKLDLMAEAGAACPICESKLDAAGCERLRARFESEGRGMGDEHRANAAKIKDLDSEIDAAQRRLEAVERQLQQQNGLERRLATLDKSLADGREAEGRLAEVRRQASEVARRIDAGSYAQDEQQKLRDLAERIAGVGYDAARHRVARERCSQLGRYEEAKARLEMAEGRVPEEKVALERLGRIEAERQGALGADKDRAKALEAELAKLNVVAQDLRRTEADLEEQISLRSRAQQEQGRAQQLWNNCEYMRGQRAEKQAARNRAAEEKGIYEELAVAFGKKGIQAMIIEGSIPEIEQEANAILSRMTDNRLHVTFETQRDARTGDGVVETLDIKISDELGVRNLELYSGGEAFRVNFAIRVALSKLLAHRAGARLQTLVIDEGFGTQDAFGRQRLVEAIYSISDDFEKIIVVTHIEELKDAFPTRIEVVKGPEGSRVWVST